jgi:hypothetical protein
MRRRQTQHPPTFTRPSISDAARGLAASTRFRQGLPAIVDDPAVLARLASLLLSSSPQARTKQTRYQEMQEAPRTVVQR